MHTCHLMCLRHSILFNIQTQNEGWVNHFLNNNIHFHFIRAFNKTKAHIQESIVVILWFLCWINSLKWLLLFQHYIRAFPPILRKYVCQLYHSVFSNDITGKKLVCRFAIEFLKKSLSRNKLRKVHNSLQRGRAFPHQYIFGHPSEAGKLGFSYLTASWEVRNEIWRVLTPLTDRVTAG